jgi:hypothetical protein
VAGYAAWRAWGHDALHKTARNIALTLAAQILTGHHLPELPADHRRAAQRRGGAAGTFADHVKLQG